MDNERPSQKALYDRARYASVKAQRQIYQRDYYYRNKEAVRSRNRSWREKNRRLDAIIAVVGRAKSRGIAYDKEHMRALECPATCPILGTPISFKNSREKRHASNVASFDRINNDLGYVAGNVQIISRMANTMKSNASKDELIMFAKWVLRTYA